MGFNSGLKGLTHEARARAHHISLGISFFEVERLLIAVTGIAYFY
jgi:hypothetical protein